MFRPAVLANIQWSYSPVAEVVNNNELFISMSEQKRATYLWFLFNDILSFQLETIESADDILYGHYGVE